MKRILILLTILIAGCSKDEILTPIVPQPPVVEIVKKNYKKTSYELSNYDNWFDGNSIYENGILYKSNNPLNEQQSCQIDFNGDGIEDVFAYDGYDLKINPTPNPPPVVYLNDGSKLNRVVTGLTSIKNPHASKILIGDFDGDSLPDIFSSVAIDQPNGVLFPTMTDVSHLIFNSKNGFNRVKEFDEVTGYWYTSCSGDIDNDNDLDIIMFNFHQSPPIGNGVKSRILRNDGIGNFKSDTTGIGSIPFVSDSELMDVNKDGFLDLVIKYSTPSNTPCPCNIPTNVSILWGNGKEFSLNKSTEFSMGNNINIVNIDFMNIDNDNVMEILISANDESGKFYIELFKSEDNGIHFINKTSTYIDDNKCNRFAHMRVQDIDKNGKLDLFSGDKRENNRWEWNGFKFIKQ
jgi:hypothetical protein